MLEAKIEARTIIHKLGRFAKRMRKGRAARPKMNTDLPRLNANHVKTGTATSSATIIKIKGTTGMKEG